MNKIIASLDIGNSKTACAIGEYNIKEEKTTIKSIGIKETKGFINGRITDEKEFNETIIKTIASAEKIYGKNIKEIFVNISGLKTISDIITITHVQKAAVLSSFALKNIGSKVISTYETKKMEVLHLFVLNEIVEKKQDNSETKFKITFFVLSAMKDNVQYIEKLLKKNNLDATFISGSYSSALSITNEIDRRNGVLTIDIGSQNTDFCIINNNKLLLCSSIGIGGKSITENLSYILETTAEIAEKIKVENVKMLADNFEEEQLIKFDLNNNTEEHFRLAQIKKKVVNDIFKNKIDEIFNNIFSLLEDKKMLSSFKEIIITGGGSNIYGIEMFISNRFNVPVRRNTPLNNNMNVNLNLDKNKIKNPIYSTSIGLISFAVESYKQNNILNNNKKHSNFIFNFFDKIVKILVDIFIS